MSILTDGPGSHVEHFIVAFVELVVKQADSLVDVVGFDLAHHI